MCLYSAFAFFGYQEPWHACICLWGIHRSRSLLYCKECFSHCLYKGAKRSQCINRGRMSARRTGSRDSWATRGHGIWQIHTRLQQGLMTQHSYYHLFLTLRPLVERLLSLWFGSVVHPKVVGSILVPVNLIWARFCYSFTCSTGVPTLIASIACGIQGPHAVISELSVFVLRGLPGHNLSGLYLRSCPHE